jgi:hypothetical protein
MTDTPKTCGIPPTSSTPCDLAWGHAGEFHAHEGFRFRVDDFAEEHTRRQKETGNLPKPVFNFSINYDVTYSVEEIWPDGDAPESPTLDDVMAVIVKCGGKRRVLEDWSMTNDLELTVSDSKHSRVVQS